MYWSCVFRAVMRSVALVVMLLSAGSSRAGHYAGGSITWDCLGAGQYEIHLDLFLDCSGFTIIPQDITFSSDCGTTYTVQDLLPTSQQEVSQLCAAQMVNSTCNGGALPGITWYQFVTLQNLPPCDSWNVSWNICCRSNAVNLVGNQGMYIDAEINTLDAPCDDSPVFTDQSLPYVCLNQPVYYNFGVTEPDGNTLTYSLISGQLFAGTAQGLNYQPGFTGALPVPGITLDPITGQIVFTPTVSGNYVVVVQVEEWDDNGNLLSVVMRDITFVVVPCTGNAPQTQGVVNNTGGILTGSNSIEVCDGEPFCVDVLFTDADPGTVLQVVSQAAALLPGSTFSVLGANPATARICWTGDLANSPVNVLIQADDGNCPIENTTSLAVNITTVDAGGVAPSPGTNGAVQVCPGSGAFFLTSVLGGTPDVNGYWTDPNGNAHNGDFDPLTDPAGVYTYTVGTACASASATATVNYLPAADAGADAGITLCSNASASNLFNVLGGSPDAGGSWTAPGGGPFSGVYDPAINSPGVYTYSVASANACPGASASINVSEVAAPLPGSNGAVTFCSNSGAQNLFAFLGGSPQAGGIWSAPGGGAFSGSYAPALNAPGIYTYTVVGSAPCPNGTSTVTVTENALPIAGTNGTVTVCSNAAAFSLPAQLGGSPGAGGVWTAPGGAVHGAGYDPAVDVPGVYTYTLTGTAPCPNAAATVTVNENLAPNAGANGTLSVCSNGGTANLVDQLAGAQSNGTWTAPGGVASLGTYNPAVDGPGVYTYTVTGMPPCVSDQATVTVTEPSPPNAGADGSLAVCGNNLSTNLHSLLVGAQAGGTWTGPGGSPFSGFYDPAVDASGIYTYTVAGVAPCPSDAAIVTVTENVPPVAGADAAITLCGTSPATALFPLLVGAQGGGFWSAPGNVAFSGTYDPAVNASGVYTYAILGIAPCLSDAAFVTVTENQQPAAGADGSIALCGTSPQTALLPSLPGAQVGGTWTAPGGGPFGGTYDPALHAPGVYTYTLVGIAPCVNDQATMTVVENAPADAGADGALVVCSNSAATTLFSQLAGADGGGSWTGPGGVPSSGIYDPAVDAPGAYAYTVNGAAPCAADQSTVIVTENPAPNAGADASLVTCSSSAPSALMPLLIGGQAGGAWAAPGGAPFIGTYDPTVDGPGVYTYTLNGIAPCASDQAAVTVTENAAPFAGADGALSVCGDSPPSSLFAQLAGADAGGAWTAPGGAAFNGTYDPALDGPGVYLYTVSGAAPCGSDAASVTVVENPVPDAGSDGALAVCASDAPAPLFPLLGGAQPGGSWAAPGGGAFSGVYDPSINGPGVYTYTVSGIAPCVNDAATITVTEDAPSGATIAYGAAAYCATSGTVNIAVVGTSGGMFSAAPLGLLLSASTGSVDPTGSAPGIYTVTYALPANGVCTATSATVDIGIVSAPEAGTDASITVCDQGGPVDLFTQLTGAQTGGTWAAPGGGAFSGTYDPAVNVSGAYVYVVPGSAPCVSDQSIVVVNETGAPDAGTDGVLTLCSNGAATDLFASLGGGAQTGGTWSGPGGAHGATVDPAIDAAGVYVYTLAATAPCLSDQSQVTVTINSSPEAGSDGAITICDQGAPTGLFPLLSGAQAGGSWSAPGGGAFSGTYDPASDVSGPYTYTVNGIAPCAADQATVMVNETGTPDAGSDGVLTICSSSSPTALFPQLTGAQLGGTWTAPGGGAHSGIFDPAVDAPGTYTYNLTATFPCAADQSQVTVTVESAPDAGTDGAITVCDQGAPVPLIGQLSGSDGGGIWTAPGGSGFSGTYDPLVDVSGVYTYTVNGTVSCAADQASVLVNETGAPFAGVDGQLTLCSYDAVATLIDALGGAPQPGGAWTAPGGVPHGTTIDPDSDPAGIYTYAIAGVFPCPGDQAQVTVVINGAPMAGGDGAIAVCDVGVPVGLAASLSGAQAGGTWTDPGGLPFSGIYDPAINNPGDYEYIVAGIAPCAADHALVTVTETGSPSAGTDGDLALCTTSPTVDLFLSLVGAQAGGSWTAPGGVPHGPTFDPSTDAAGVYTYTLTASAPCVGDMAQVNVSLVAPSSAGQDGALTVCEQGAPMDLAIALAGAEAGGQWTNPGGGVFAGTYDPAVDLPGAYTYTVMGDAPCASDQAVIMVTETGSPDAGADGTITLCANSPATELFAALGGADAGGTWTDPNGFAHGSSVDPTTDVAGNYTYTLGATAPCAGDQSEVLVTIDAAPSAGADAGISVCDQGSGIDLFTQLVGAEAGGTWSAPGGGGFSGTYEPLTDAPGVYTYTVIGNGPCPADEAVVTVAETSSPYAGADGVLDICSSTGPTVLLDHLGPGAQPGGSWTAPGGGPHSGTLVPALDQAGVYTYVIAGTPPCSSSSATLTVNIEPAPDAGIDGSFTVCTGDDPFSLFDVLGGTPDPNGTWTDILNAPFDGGFDPAISPQGMYTYTVASPICGAAIATVEMNVVLGPNAGQDNSVAVCETDAPIALFPMLLGQPATNGGWTGPDGLFFNGTLDPATAQSGSYTYTVLTFGGGCPDAQAVIDVMVSNTVSAGSLNALTLCSTNAPLALLDQLSGTPDAGGTWVDPNGAPFAGTFDPATGVGGVYTYTVQAVAPCPSASASLNVEVNDQPDAGEDATAALCSSDDAITLFSLIGGSPDQGGDWTGPDGESHGGTFVPGSSGPGAYTYFIDGISPCVSDQSVVTVSVSQAVSIGANGAASACEDAAPFALFPLLGIGTDVGGAWTAPDGSPSSGEIQPATDVSGTYTYALTAPAPCPDQQAVVVVTINDVPTPSIVLSMADGCAPVEVTFTDASNAQGAHLWDFGTGDTSHAAEPSPVVYENAGAYEITLTLTSDAGCTGSTSLLGGLQVFTRPEAAFLSGPPNLNTGAPEAWFQNQSTGAASYEWQFDELGSSSEVNPRFTFPSALEGRYTVCLTAYASDNCFDTACVDIPVPMGAGLFVPNAFSPDGDGINELFTPFVTGLKEQGYQFLVFDRWGQEIFSTTRIGNGWDGNFGTGDPAPVGVYVWKLFGRDLYGTGRVDRIGHVTLVR